jgi:hypothetical protein
VKLPGRKSAAEKLASVVNLPNRQVPPPDDLSEEAAKVWRDVVATKPVSWWDAGSLPLLAQYCRVTVEARRIDGLLLVEAEFLTTKKADLPAYSRLRRMQGSISRELAALATKMRLAQQSRYQEKSAHTAATKGGSGRKRPWE